MIRVLHFSDIHIHAELARAPVRSFLNKRTLAGLNLLLVREKLFRRAREKLTELLAFAQAEQVDFAFCSGDMTALGTDGEHRAARALIRPFEQLPLGLSVVPGNHDLYLQDAVADRRFERHFGDLMASDLAEAPVDGPFPYVRLLGEHLALIGINSAKPNPNPFVSSGRVPEAQLGALPGLLAHAALQRRHVVVVTHYGVLRKSGEPDTPRHGLENAQALLSACGSRPDVLIAHGHLHHRYVHSPASGRPWLFCSGSTTHEGREGAWLYECDATSLKAVPVGYGRDGYQALPQQAVQVVDPHESRSAGRR